MSRNLTYLGSPFQQGTGTATVMPQGDVGAAFMQSMKGIKEQRQKELDADVKKKEDSVKDWSQWKIEHYIGHSKYFLEQQEKIRNDAAKLLAEGVSMADVTNPKVADLIRQRGVLTDRAKQSELIGKYAEEFYKALPQYAGKMTKSSRGAMMEFLNKPFDEQIDIMSKGGLPSVQPVIPIPSTDVNNLVKNFSQVPDTYYGLKQADLDKDLEARQVSFEKSLRSILRPEMFDTDDVSMSPKEAMETFITSSKEGLKKTLENKLAPMQEAARTARANARKESNTQQEGNASEIFNYIDRIYARDKVSLAKLSEYAATKFSRGSDPEVLDKPAISFVKSEFDPTRNAHVLRGVKPTKGDGAKQGAGEYIVFSYPKSGETIVIRITDEKGNPDPNRDTRMLDLFGFNYQEMERRKGTTGMGIAPGAILRPGATPTRNTSGTGGGQKANDPLGILD